MSVATMASLIPASSRHLVEPVGLARPVLDEGLAVAGEVAELPDRGRRHEAPPQEPALQQLRDPGAVGHIGLPPGHVGHVGGVDQEEREGILEHVVDRFPVDPRALHRHVGHPGGGEPIPQRQQLRGGGPERLDDLRTLPGGSGDAHAGGDGRLVDIETGAALQDDVHGPLLYRPAPRGASRGKTLLGVLVATGRGT